MPFFTPSLQPASELICPLWLFGAIFLCASANAIRSTKKYQPELTRAGILRNSVYLPAIMFLKLALYPQFPLSLLFSSPSRRLLWPLPYPANHPADVHCASFPPG